MSKSEKVLALLNDVAKYAIITVVIFYLVKQEAKGAIKAVSDARDNARNRLTDIFAGFTGLKRREERIWNDPEYRRRYLNGLND